MSLMEAIEKGDLATVKALIASGIDINKIERDRMQTPLQQAADRGDLEIVQALLQAGARLEAEYRSPLEAAIWKNHIAVARQLIEFYPYSDALHDVYAKSLQLATISGQVEAVQCLLTAGIDVNAIVGETGTALHYAAEREQLAVAQLLVDAGADINCRNTSPDAYGRVDRTPLMEAICSSTSMSQLLVDAGADVNAADRTGQTLLMMAAEGDRTDIPQQLLDAGASINAQDREGKTALIIAADLGNSAVVKLLIEAGADVNQRDRTGNTALAYAEQENPNLDNIPLDSDFGPADEDNIFCQSERYHDALEKRASIRRRRIATYLRQAGASEPGMRELMLVKAAARGTLGEVEALIDTGAQVNQQVPNFGTALLQASIQGHQEIVATLLAEGADPNLHNAIDSQVPIIQAAEKGFLEIVRLLLDAGADPHATDSIDENWEGYTALDRAQMEGHREIVQLLRYRGGPRQRRSPVAVWRGLVSDNLNDFLILVQATVDEVAAAFCQVRGATVWEKDVFEHEVELTNQCFVVFQFTGHPWTLIHEENVYSWSKSLNREDAEAISQHLRAKAIYYGVSDTAGAIGYDLYQSGSLMESFDSCCDYDFDDEIESGGEPDTTYGSRWKLYSKLRHPNPNEIKRDFDFVDAFFRAQDAYVPAWGGGWRTCGTGQRRRLQVTGLDPDDLRMDYVAVKP